MLEVIKVKLVIKEIIIKEIKNNVCKEWEKVILKFSHNEKYICISDANLSRIKLFFIANSIYTIQIRFIFYNATKVPFVTL